MKAIEKERKRRKGKIIFLTKQEGYYWKKAIQIKDSCWNYLVLGWVWWDARLQIRLDHYSMTCEKVRNNINLCWFESDLKSWMIIYKGRLNKTGGALIRKVFFKLQITNPCQIQISVPDTCLCKKLKNDINLCWFEIDKKSWLFNYKGCLDKPDRWWSDKKEKWIGSKKKELFFLFFFKCGLDPMDQHKSVDESFTQVQRNIIFPAVQQSPTGIRGRVSEWLK